MKQMSEMTRFTFYQNAGITQNTFELLSRVTPHDNN